MRKRILVLLTAAALAVSSLPIGVCADTNINSEITTDFVDDKDIGVEEADEELVGTGDYYYYQMNYGSKWCYLTSWAMFYSNLFDRRIDPNEIYSANGNQVDCNSSRIASKYGCTSHYLNMKSYSTSQKDSKVKELLASHPEGVLVDINKPGGGLHCVLARRVSNNTVYFYDPGIYNGTNKTVNQLYGVKNGWGDLSYVYWATPNNPTQQAPVDATPQIRGQSVPADFQKEGVAFNVRGVVSCAAPMSAVHVYVLNGSGKAVTGKSVYPNSKSYNIKNVDNDVKFSKLPATNCYEYKITAIVNGKEYCLFSKWFWVVNGSTRPFDPWIKQSGDGNYKTITWGATYADGYHIDVRKNGNLIKSEDLGNVTSWSNTFTPGNYVVYITAYNGAGGSNTVSTEIHIAAPTATPTPTPVVICSGDCSKSSEDNVKWQVIKKDDGTSKLIISGQGEMRDYYVVEGSITPEKPEYVSAAHCDISEVEICKGITSIGSNAFYGTELKEIDIAKSVTFIGKGAFCACQDLKEIDIPKNVISIEDYTFGGCTELEEISIPKSVTSIGERAFVGCWNLKEIDIPKSVISIGECAFGSCRNLESINIPDGVTSIEAYTFYNCPKLESINIPYGVTSIGEEAFWGTLYKNVKIPNSVKSIGNMALVSCEDIYYDGTKEEWDKIDKSDSSVSDSVTIHFLKTEAPTATPRPAATAAPTATPTPKPTATPVPTSTPTSAAVKLTGQICGTGLSLKGKIGANVLLGFTDTKAVEDMDPSVIINVDGKETVLKLSEQEHYTSGKKEIYEIQTYVPAKQINEKIDLKLIDKNGNTITLRYGKKNLSSFTFSVSEITDSYLTNYEQYGEKTIDLVTAIQNYCGYAQLMTGYKTNTAKITDKLLYISAKDLKPYATVVDKGSKIAKYAGTGLALQSDTTMQIYFKLADNVDAYTITLDGEAVTPEDCGSGIYCVELKSIPAGKLSTASEIVISKSGETFTIKASALSWAESVLSNTKGQKQTTIDMAKMLYRYSQKADAYFAKK